MSGLSPVHPGSRRGSRRRAGPGRRGRSGARCTRVDETRDTSRGGPARLHGRRRVGVGCWANKLVANSGISLVRLSSAFSAAAATPSARLRWVDRSVPAVGLVLAHPLTDACARKWVRGWDAAAIVGPSGSRYGRTAGTRNPGGPPPGRAVTGSSAAHRTTIRSLPKPGGSQFRRVVRRGGRRAQTAVAQCLLVATGHVLVHVILESPWDILPFTISVLAR
jgi:hypothetical protein